MNRNSIALNKRFENLKVVTLRLLKDLQVWLEFASRLSFNSGNLRAATYLSIKGNLGKFEDSHISEQPHI